MLASKHMDIVLGLDIHLVNIPPSVGVPLPHPFIGIVFDPMDYVPFIGATVNVNNMKRSNAGSSVMLGTKHHIPFGAGFTMEPLIAHDGKMFFGSATVNLEGSYMSVASFQLMTCSCVGLPLSISFGKKPTHVLPSMYLPTSYSIPLPMGAPVNVGGPIVPDVATMLKGLAMSSLFSFVMKFGVG